VSWSDLTEWWLEEVTGDPAYEEIVTPLLLDVLDPAPGRRYLDVGCGEGRVMRRLSAMGANVHGVDINPDLAQRAGGIVGDMLALPFGDGEYDGVYTVLTLEHVEDDHAFFREAARVTRPGGVLALVMNHPVWTAPESTPISDSDGEILWRPGEYFSRGVSELAAGEETVSFHHRSMSDLLNAASDAGWALEHMVEQPHHELEDQAGIPRLLACRWRLH
jgi:ubiquinone/menaquinone biosynthesis C-methylase UbiE